MKTTGTCCSASASPCDTTIAELPRYYPRQLITPDDLTLEQNYFRDRMRRHNRLLHGWGVVCGALVCPVPNPNSTGSGDQYLPWQVKVQRGYVLGPYGDEIILDCERTVDVRTNGTMGITGEPCLDTPDPWCSQVFVNPTNTTVYIAVKYRQCMTRPVRVQPVGCGCNDSSCEYSRWQDGYEIGVLTECPSCNDELPTVGMGDNGNVDLSLIPQGDSPGCPDCKCGPWVGLAEVTLDANGKITKINNTSCRRMVLSFGQFWWSCQGQKPTITQLTSDPVTAGTTGNSMKLIGTNFRCGATASFDNTNFVVTAAKVQDPQTMMLTVDVSSAAKHGDQAPKITAMDIDGTSSDPFPSGLTIQDASTTTVTTAKGSLVTNKQVKKTTKVPLSTPKKPE